MSGTFDPLALSNAAPTALFVLDAQRSVVFANRAALSMLALLPSQLVATPFLEHVAETHRELVAEALGTPAFRLEATLLDRDGHRVATFLRGEQAGGRWCVSAEDRALELELRAQLATAREATEFQLARAVEMADRNTQLLAVLEGHAALEPSSVQADDAVERALRSASLSTWHWDVVAGGVTLRGACDALFGFRPTTLTEIREGLAVEDRDALWSAADRARRERAPVDLRVRVRSRTGATRVVRVVGLPRADARGEVVAVDGMLVDESDLERERSGLARLDHELRVLVEGMSDGVVLIGRDWRVSYVNPRGAELLGRTAAEMTGRALDEVLPLTGAAFQRAHRKAMKERVRVEVEDVYEPLGRTFSNRVYPTDDGIAIFFQDVTERQRREERLRRSEQRLRELGARMQQAREAEAKRIAREIHDDLGQSLTVLKMDVARLRRLHGEDPGCAEPLAEMDAVVDGAITATRRIASDLRPVVLDDLGLASAIRWHADQVSARAGFAVDLDVADGDVSVDPAVSIVLYRVLQEALTNVARHARARRVAVALRTQPDHVALEVRDDGRGFDPDVPTRSLGLLGMRERAASVGGAVLVESRAGKGTTVRVLVPRRIAPDMASAP